jgi:phenylacetate-coenzyme A ligase PaaK-like adenylate-forming protein
MWQSVRLVYRALREKAVLRWQPEQILALQQRRLRALVAYAKARSPFFAELYRDIDPGRFRLEELPIINKTRMMENYDRFLTDRRLKKAGIEEFMSDPGRLGKWYLGEYAPSRTSGTQGLQAFIVQDRLMMELLFALQMTRGTVYPTSPSGILERLFRRARLAVVTIGQGFYPSAAALVYAPPASNTFVKRLWLHHIEPLEQVVEELNRFRPNVLLAYANVLEMLGREELADRLHLSKTDQLRQIINMSEPLSEGARNLVQRAFGIKVTNNYAMGECMALSTGCAAGHGMHLQADWAILEVVDRDNQLVAPGRPGEKVLMTNLYNYVQPFIRYEIGDVVTMSPNPCPCGSPLPLILKVEGRTDEVVWIRDGGIFRQVHPYVFVDCLDEFPAVGWYQIIQIERNHFLLRASAAPGRQVHRQDLEAVMQRGLSRFGLSHLIRLDIEITKDIAPDPRSGKLKRITSRIGAPPQTAGVESCAIPEVRKAV